MILIDLNQLVFSTIAVQSQRMEMDENLIRHIVLNCIRTHRSKFHDKYGEIVIATDNKHYWRREVFPYYKANRKKDREKSSLNWPVIFECMSKIKTEIKENFPYKFLDVHGAEADDVISVLVEIAPYDEPILIVSGDKDFIQLQTVKPLVDQYDPVRKRWLNHANPDLYLQEHIIKGDRGDGVPNVRTDDSALALGERQKSISKKMLDEWMEDGVPRNLDRNYQRNRMLIDLTQVPDQVRSDIIEAFKQEPEGKRSKLFNYFVKHKLKNLMEDISQF
jgi:5'-3' exonuclease